MMEPKTINQPATKPVFSDQYARQCLAYCSPNNNCWNFFTCNDL